MFCVSKILTQEIPLSNKRHTAPATKLPTDLFTPRPHQPVVSEPWCRLSLVNGGHALISVSDWELASQHPWRSVRTSQGKRRSKVYIMADDVQTLYLHRLIMNPRIGQTVDHIDGDPFDNRREKLRIATRQENARNRHPSTFARGTSKYRGVSWEKRKRKWLAAIYVNGRQIYLGIHATAEEAARAYDAASLEHYGRFGTRNFT